MTFEYGGWHFTPAGNFDEKMAYEQFINRLFIDHELGLYATWCAPGSKFPYSYRDFHQASGKCDNDLFRCIENGKLYSAFNDGLFRFEKN